jgi:P4 family phage/plasmid primase-like protien
MSSNYVNNIWTDINNQSIILTEKVSRNNLLFIQKNWNDDYIQSHLTQTSDETDKNGETYDKIKAMKTTLNKYIKKMDSEGNIPVLYRQKGSKARKGGLLGRYFCEGSLGLQSLKKCIRHSISGMFYWDLDMINAHPQMLRQYCKMNDFQTPYLTHYCKNRDEIILQSDLDKDTFKTEFLAIMNGRQFQKNKYQIRDVDEFFTEWNNEATNILKFIVDKNPDIKASKKDHNENGSITNKLLCSIENTILHHTFSFLINIDYSPDVLCFDGIMVRQKGELSKLESELKNLSKYIKATTAYKMKFLIKPMNKGFDLSKVKSKLTGETESKYFSDPINDLVETIRNGEKGFSELIYDLFAKDYIKITSSEPFSAFIWNEDKLVWFPTNKPYLIGVVSSLINTHIKKCIKILEFEKIKHKDDSNAIESIHGCIEHFLKTLKQVSTSKFARSVIELIIPDIYEEEFASLINQEKYFLPIKNGRKISLKTLEITPRTINDYFDYELPVDYTNEPQELKLIDDFTLDLMGISDHNKELEEYKNHNPVEEQKALQINLGYCISGENKEKVFFIFHGNTGNNGKSTITDLVATVFGKTVATIDKSIIEEKEQQRAGAPNPALYAIKDLHLGFIHEPSDSLKLSTNDIKQLTSGGCDSISCRQLRQTQITFIPKMKPVIVSNYKPTFDATDQAFNNRIRFVPFLNYFEGTKEQHALVKDIKENHKDAFFSWCLAGAQKYFELGYLPQTQVQKDEVKKMSHENNFIKLFIEEQCDINTPEELKNDSNIYYYPVTEFKKKLTYHYPNAKVRELENILSKLGIIIKYKDGYKRFKGIKPKEVNFENHQNSLLSIMP